MAFPKRAAILTAVIAATLTSCAAPNPNAAPTFTCTPTTGTPAPCYKAEYDLQTKQDDLYNQAETTHRKYLTEEERVYRIGGITTPTPVLLETTTGEYLENAMATFRQLKASGGSVRGGEFKLTWVHRRPELNTGQAVATLQVCVDARSVMTKLPGKREKPGRAFERTVYFVIKDNSLKMATLDLKEVASCES